MQKVIFTSQESKNHVSCQENLHSEIWDKVTQSATQAGTMGQGVRRRMDSRKNLLLYFATQSQVSDV